MQDSGLLSGLMLDGIDLAFQRVSPTTLDYFNLRAIFVVLVADDAIKNRRPSARYQPAAGSFLP